MNSVNKVKNELLVRDHIQQEIDNFINQSRDLNGGGMQTNDEFMTGNAKF